MTDLETRPEQASGDGGDDRAAAEAGAVQWAQADPPKKRRLGLWLGLGIPTGLVAAAAVVASLVLIAPGVTAAATPVGLMTQGMAAETISQRLATTEFTIGDATVTGEQLGLSVDAQAAAADAFETYPAWNLGGWGQGEVSAPVSVDAEKAAEALREALPSLYTDSVNAKVVFDDESGRFTVEAAEPGQGVDVEALAAGITDALAKGETTVEPQQTEVKAAATTEEAEAFAAGLNDQADAAGFYLEDKRASELSLKDVQSWMDIEADPASGDFVVTADKGAIEEAIKDLPEKVNQDVRNEQVVTNSKGDHLRVIQEGQDGFGIASTDGVADRVAETLSSGDLEFTLEGEVVPYESEELFRRAEVDKSAGMTYMYENEKLVASYPIALGTGGVRDGIDTETHTGHFTVYAQLTSQNMGSCNPDGTVKEGGKFGYCTANVPFVTYFNGDQGFHGTYWHNNFGAGARMSHGCVNMTQAAAEHMYYFAQTGTEVWVHD
ncbi:L,D-transpeptidase family protein [Microbacterium marinilacus]|uniref:L,D-transpeptidase family protein n=1 Tax=Microbacterium marinilacus TaxID=415209 RepID=A0ABP7BCT5_9MICO|nr:L,D-transpeptidase family protein [Microbacterium marinilacus]MBY0689328.1 L,D-transpeptidase/peptidoglycan binding protein [Microbacterium marinilacus]